ncbi:hypothetical protein [Streptomyces platensis]|nr:hypothetical protein [Streptomyces platensis]
MTGRPGRTRTTLTIQAVQDAEARVDGDKEGAAENAMVLSMA